MKSFKHFPFVTLIFYALAINLMLLSGCNSGKTNTGTESNTGEMSNNFEPDIDIEMVAVEAQAQVLPGEKTRVYTYQAKLLKGEKAALTSLSDTYLGPVIRVQRGQKIRVRFKNQLPNESVIHWHGLHIPPEMDGHPMHAISNGEQYIYEFEVNNRPGTYWFHPHPDKITGPQVYRGLAGMFIVENENDALPSGKYDKPIIIQDRTFDTDNQLVYVENSRMARMRGFMGENILINGKINQQEEIEQATYRFRVLNGSNARIYKLAWSDGSDIIAIATDGGLLEQPVKKPYLMLAPGERVEIWKDFSGFNTGKKISLKSLSFNPGSSMGMGGMMDGGMMNERMSQTSAIENGDELTLMQFSTSSEKGPQKEIPSQLSHIETLAPTKAINQNNPRTFHFAFEHMEWVINGETFEMNEVAEWEKVKLNTTEIWEFVNGNDGGGMGMMGNMMQMPHPVHIHGLQFQIIDRDVSGADPAAWQTVKNGFLDKGWQDTFLLLPGTKARVIMRFKDFTGTYIYHCHNLEHEDMGMMRNYEVLK
ncbi:MAG TPA: multicopper oxidase family protein [Bacteroidales bacterium]|nr:multicopper oxidase family protein [Bacteroidales bacterium]